MVGNTTTVFSTQGTAPTAAPARARPRPCAHLLPVSARFTASAHHDGQPLTGTGALAHAARAPFSQTVPLGAITQRRRRYLLAMNSIAAAPMGGGQRQCFSG